MITELGPENVNKHAVLQQETCLRQDFSFVNKNSKNQNKQEITAQIVDRG